MKRIIAFILALLMLALPVLSGCGKNEDNEAATEAADKFADPNVIAVINGENVYIDDLYFYIDEIVGDIQQQTGSAPGWENTVGADGTTARDMLIRSALEYMQSYYGFYFEAKALGAYPEEEANAYVTEVIASEGGEDVIKNVYNFNIDSFKKNLKITYAYTPYIMATTSEEEAKAQFEDMLTTTDYMYVKHILLEFATRDSEEAALEEANAIYKRAVGGESFEALIGEFNEDPGSQDPEVGYLFTEGEMVQEFEDASKALNVGEISNPVKTAYGYHIIKKYDIPKEGDAVYDRYVESFRYQSLTEEKVTELLEKYPMEIDDSKFSTVDLTRYTSAQ